MKKNKKLAQIACCGLIVIIIGLLAGCGKGPGDDAYTYPSRPGTEAWNKFTTLDEMITACQVPEDVLKDMSTQGLVETAITYPLMGNIVFFNDTLGALNDMLKQSNAIQALLQRADAGTEMLAKYRTMDPAAVKSDWADYDRVFYPLKFMAIEILMGQDVIVVQFTPEQRQELIELAKAKYQAKKQSPFFTNTQLPDTANSLVITLQQYGK
jgi:hypothetical protein